MVETEYRLDESVRAVIGADGTAFVGNIGPKNAHERWIIESQSVNGDSIATLQVFRGNDTSRQLDITVTANNDTSDSEISLRNGEMISYRWSKGTVNANMIVHIEGKRIIKGMRAY